MGGSQSSPQSRIILADSSTLFKVWVHSLITCVLQSTGIGKTLARLKKSGPEEIRKTAEELVMKWKKAVPRPAPVPATQESTAKRPRSANMNLILQQAPLLQVL